ncbi:hypothetical protein A8F94_18690 [Bacillus sp. FJAT-27225]|nr:hypothetical protein A8F94_18690 [Bacillus sp. FJAT-27225]
MFPPLEVSFYLIIVAKEVIYNTRLNKDFITLVEFLLPYWIDVLMAFYILNKFSAFNPNKSRLSFIGCLLLFLRGQCINCF